MRDQQNNRKYLINIMMSIQYLCKQNIILQGLTKETDNFYQLMELVEKLKPSGKALRDDKYMSPEIKNEIIEYFADAARKVIISEIRWNMFFGMSGDKNCDRNN